MSRLTHYRSFLRRLQPITWLVQNPVFPTNHLAGTSKQVTWLLSLRSEAHASMWRPLVSAITTLYYVAIICHHWVWYRALSLCYACICCSDIILIP